MNNILYYILQITKINEFKIGDRLPDYITEGLMVLSPYDGFHESYIPCLYDTGIDVVYMFRGKNNHIYSYEINDDNKIISKWIRNRFGVWEEIEG